MLGYFSKEPWAVHVGIHAALGRLQSVSSWYYLAISGCRLKSIQVQNLPATNYYLMENNRCKCYSNIPTKISQAFYILQSYYPEIKNHPGDCGWSSRHQQYQQQSFQSHTLEIQPAIWNCWRSRLAYILHGCFRLCKNCTCMVWVVKPGQDKTQNVKLYTTGVASIGVQTYFSCQNQLSVAHISEDAVTQLAVHVQLVLCQSWYHGPTEKKNRCVF